MVSEKQLKALFMVWPAKSGYVYDKAYKIPKIPPFLVVREHEGATMYL